MKAMFMGKYRKCVFTLFYSFIGNPWTSVVVYASAFCAAYAPILRKLVVQFPLFVLSSSDLGLGKTFVMKLALWMCSNPKWCFPVTVSVPYLQKFAAATTTLLGLEDTTSSKISSIYEIYHEMNKA